MIFSWDQKQIVDKFEILDKSEIWIFKSQNTRCKFVYGEAKWIDSQTTMDALNFKMTIRWWKKKHPWNPASENTNVAILLNPVGIQERRSRNRQHRQIDLVPHFPNCIKLVRQFLTNLNKYNYLNYCKYWSPLVRVSPTGNSFHSSNISSAVPRAAR